MGGLPAIAAVPLPMTGATDLLSPGASPGHPCLRGRPGMDALQVVRGAVGGHTGLARAARTGCVAILISADIVRGALVVLKI